MTSRLVARLDNVGDVVLSGPAVRAVAAAGEPVTFLAGPQGAPAARLLPGVGEVLELDAPWVPFDPRPVDRLATLDFVEALAEAQIDEAIILTSFHQSPLPLALLLRLAGVPRIAATCVDYPGGLLDVRHPYVPSLHEVEQSLSLCDAAGYRLPAGDDGALRLSLGKPSMPPALVGRRYVVIHPGASVPARRLPDADTAALIAALTARGVDVVITGSVEEAARAARLGACGAADRTHVVAGTTDLAALAGLLAGATAAVCGNTAAMHLAAAVGTPVVAAFAPVVPHQRWRPWKVDHVLLGTLDIVCAGCRSRSCPIPGQPCLRPFNVPAALTALDSVGAFRPAQQALEAAS